MLFYDNTYYFSSLHYLDFPALESEDTLIKIRQNLLEAFRSYTTGNESGKVILRLLYIHFLTPDPKAGVIVVACAVRAAAGINLVGVAQTKPMQ